MLLGKVKKALICSVKDPALERVKIFLIKKLDLDGNEKEEYTVGIDNKLDVGIGDLVLYVIGSNSRLLIGNEKIPIDCSISAIVESINIDEKYKNY